MWVRELTMIIKAANINDKGPNRNEKKRNRGEEMIQYGDVIIFDNKNGQCVNLPNKRILLKWNEHLAALLPVDGKYWATGMMRRATENEKQTVRYGNQKES
jgi:hypothetical protein